jgi:riboflavin kinase/FMN adenylyltransferase
MKRVFALGNFDGVHCGHNAVLAELRALAAEHDAAPCVITFSPHPRRVLYPDAPPFQLVDEYDKEQLLHAAGIAEVVVLAFTPALAALEPEDFLEQKIFSLKDVVGIVVGDDFAFGAKRRGNVALLQGVCAARGVSCVVVSGAAAPTGARYGSSAIRAALFEGMVETATALLGRPWAISGTVEPGDGAGRGLGFPTANIALGEYTRPRFGVYAVRVGELRGVANIGVKPTIGGMREPVLEVHLFDVEADLYGKRLSVELLKFIRPEMKFSGVEALKAQIGEDAQAARAIIKS